MLVKAFKVFEAFLFRDRLIHFYSTFQSVNLSFCLAAFLDSLLHICHVIFFFTEKCKCCWFTCRLLRSVKPSRAFKMFEFQIPATYAQEKFQTLHDLFVKGESKASLKTTNHLTGFLVYCMRLPYFSKIIRLPYFIFCFCFFYLQSPYSSHPTKRWTWTWSDDQNIQRNISFLWLGTRIFCEGVAFASLRLYFFRECDWSCLAVE